MTKGLLSFYLGAHQWWYVGLRVGQDPIGLSVGTLHYITHHIAIFPVIY